MPSRILINGDRKTLWRTPQGITLGTTLKELEALNGRPFILAGYAWDYGGTIYSWEGGQLAERLGPSVLIRLDADMEKVSEEEFFTIIGDGGFPSDHKVMQKMNPRVSAIEVSFK